MAEHRLIMVWFDDRRATTAAPSLVTDAPAMNRLLACCALIPALAAPPRSARADAPGAEASRGAARAFDERVAPVLARHCLECHGPALRKGGLSLATEDAFRQGGHSGPAVEPGEPESSLPWELVASGAKERRPGERKPGQKENENRNRMNHPGPAPDGRSASSDPPPTRHGRFARSRPGRR
jgi:hypothetical protein